MVFIMDRRYISFVVCLSALILISSSAFGWLNGYDYMRPIQFNTIENFTNHQLLINITNKTNMQLNCVDLNITYEDNITKIPYWIENCNTSYDYALVWIKANFSTYNKSKYMWYGNTSPTSSLSNIDVTAIFGDSFPGSSINASKWNNILSLGGGITDATVSNSQLIYNCTSATGGGSLPIKNELPKASYTVRIKIDDTTDNGQQNAQIRFQTMSGTDTGILYNDGVYFSGNAENVWYRVNGVGTSTAETFNNANNRIIEYDIASEGNFTIDSVLENSVSSSVPTIDDYFRIFIYTQATVTIDWIFIREYTLNEPTYSIGTEKTPSTSPPTITITTPTNITYYTSIIPINITVSDESASFSCNISDNGSLLTTLTTNTTYTTNLTKTGGNHNINISCNDSDGDTSSDIEYYYVWSGLNLSAYYSDSGNLSDDWGLYITNSTDNYSNLSVNGTILLEWDTIPTGNITIVANESNATLYYINATTNTTLNSSVYLDLNLTLTLKTSNTVTVTSSLGLSLLEGQTTTVLCNSTEGTQTLSINDVYVSNPYILTVGVGFYDLFCQVPETASYTPTNKSEQISVNALFSCTTVNTFAFEYNITTTGNITTLNFTDLVSQNLLKSDLSDINISGAVEIWKNTTDGYYIIVNNTGTYDLNIQFGNYYANNSYSLHARTTPLYDVTGYTQINPYQTYNLLDELTGEYLYPPNSTILVIIGCSQGETYINIAENDTQFLIATTNYINKSSVRVTYTADAYYSRQLYPTYSDALILKFYLADAYTTAIDRIDFIMQDQNYYNSKLQVYKTLDAEYIIITEGYFDVSRQFSTYLQEDIDYYLRTNDDGSLTDFGRITIVAPDIKYLGLVNMDLTPDVQLMGAHVTSNVYTADNYTALHIYYNDDLDQTINATIITYYENGSIFQSYFSSGVDTINIEYNISDFNETSFYVTFNVWHETFGNSPLKWSQNVFYPTIFDLGISTYWYNIIGLAFLMVVALLVSSGSVIAGSLIFLIVMFVLMGLQWINMGLGVVGLVIFLMLLATIKEVKGGGS